VVPLRIVVPRSQLGRREVTVITSAKTVLYYALEIVMSYSPPHWPGKTEQGCSCITNLTCFGRYDRGAWQAVRLRRHEYRPSVSARPQARNLPDAIVECCFLDSTNRRGYTHIYNWSGSIETLRCHKTLLVGAFQHPGRSHTMNVRHCST